MNYVSIDIETTGLDPDNDQVLQIAAVVDGPEYRRIPVEELPFYETALQWDRVSGNPFAMQLNAGLLQRIADHVRTETPADAMIKLRQFVIRELGRRQVVAAGKNFASFDRQFLKRLDLLFTEMLHHRCIDPAMFYVTTSDLVPPSTDECLKRAGLEGKLTTHDALDDARNIVHLIRASGRI